MKKIKLYNKVEIKKNVKELENFTFEDEELVRLGFKCDGHATEYGERAWRWIRGEESIIAWDVGNGFCCVMGRQA
jgi:hypothetical protein